MTMKGRTLLREDGTTGRFSAGSNMAGATFSSWMGRLEEGMRRVEAPRRAVSRGSADFGGPDQYLVLWPQHNVREIRPCLRFWALGDHGAR
jgi:hypothetical protein